MPLPRRTRIPGAGVGFDIPTDPDAYSETTDQFLLPGHATRIDTDDVFLIATPIQR